MEIWKDIKGYEGHYQISNKGAVKRLGRITLVSSKNQYSKYTSEHRHKERLMSLSKDGNGYPHLTLFKDGRRKSFLVHRLVAEAFIPNPKNKRTVNHKDFDKSNNHVSNLEWATYKENKAHAKDSGRLARGETQHLSKLKAWQVREIYEDREMFSDVEQAELYKVGRVAINQIVNKKTWLHITNHLK